MNQVEQWGSESWNDAHFPADRLDSEGDTWGCRWRGMEKWRHQFYLNQLENILRGPQPLDVLDIGCALCDFTEKAWNLNRENRFWATDTCEMAINWASKNFPDFQFARAALPAVPFDRRFDVILCLEVLCYLGKDDRQKAIHRIRDSLAPSGVLMFSGVLDGGVQHHTEEEVIRLIQEKFQIQKITHNHWSLHRRIIEDPFDKFDSSIESKLKLLRMSSEDFSDWCMQSSSSAKVALMKCARAINPLSTWAASLLGTLVRAVLSSKILARLGYWVSRSLLHSKHADEIIVLARPR